jgi:Zn-dependent protease
MENQESNEQHNPSIDEELVSGLREVHGAQSKFGSVTLFVITIILFFSSQIIAAKWQEVLILIGVLLFHECGHFLAMKLLKYDDVKMFFLPFLGAAVSGRAKRETALKSCIVSLMGPFPGILLGTLLYFLFFWTNNYYLLKTSQVMLLLNAFNFLPIMPLDGGRFLDVLFVKRRVFRLLFGLFGAAVFIALAISSQDFFLALIGIFAIISAFSSFKAHGAAKAIGAKGFSAVSMDELFDKPEQLAIALDVMKSRYEKLFSPNVMYRGIYNTLVVVVDTLKFVPAGIISKISLVLAYPVLLLISIAVTFFFLAINFEERVVYKQTESGKVTFAEEYMFGSIKSRIPINNSSRYDGLAIAFGRDSSIITDYFVYKDGYRNGIWITRNDTGDTIEKEVYDSGKLITRMKRAGGSWDTIPAQQLPFFQKMIATLREISQPLSSNYKYFE